MAVSGINIVARLTAKLTKTLADGSIPTQDYAAALYKVAPSDADVFYNNRLTISNGGATDLDLAGGVTDALGTTLTFAKVYGLYIHNRLATTGNVLQVGGDANSVPFFGAAADYVIVGPNACLLLLSPVDGWTVTASTGDILQIANPGGTDIACDVAILGKAA